MCLTHARRVTWEHCLFAPDEGNRPPQHNKYLNNSLNEPHLVDLDRPSGSLNSVAETTSTVFCAACMYTVRMDRTWCCNTLKHRFVCRCTGPVGPPWYTVLPESKCTCLCNSTETFTTCRYQKLPRQLAETSGAATPGISFRPLCAVMTPTLISVYFLTVAVGSHALWGASPGVMSEPPASLVGFWVAALSRSTTDRWQEATDPQSPEGGSQRACHTRGAHPTASGRHEGVALIEQTALLWQLGSCLFGLPARGRVVPFDAC